MSATESPSTADSLLGDEVSGLDRLDLALPDRPATSRRVWRAVWPKMAALVIGLLLWQLVVWSGWKPTFLLPGPVTVFRTLWDDRGAIGPGTLTTLRRAVEFYLIALVAGTLLAIAMTRVRIVREAVAPLITGLQTMPNVAWVPIAILVFGISSEQPILFVTLLGTVPAIIIGTWAGFDSIPPVLLRAGEVLGAGGIDRYRHIVLPAALPGYVAGMRQGWAFAWRSLMAGELIAQIHGHQALGNLLSSYQDQSESADLLAVMVVILGIGLLMDAVVFSPLERSVLRRRGLGHGF